MKWFGLLVYILLVGCASWNTQVTQFSKDLVVNAQANRKVCRAVLGSWDLYSNVIKESLKPEVTNETVKEMDMVSEIAKKPRKDWTDEDLGKACGGWAFIWQRIPKVAGQRIISLIAEYAALAALIP